MIRILLVDDHNLIRKGLAKVLEFEDDLEVAGEAASGGEAINMVEAGEFDVAILDLSMPGRDGLDTLHQLKVTKPSMGVLILTMYPADQYACRVIRAGASGFLAKGSVSDDELVAAIKAAAEGERYITPEVASLLAEELDRGDGRPLYDLLSDREFQVMLLIAAGRKLKEIGEDLSLSAKTISTYQQRIFDKLQVRSQVELVRYVLKMGLGQ